MSHIRLTDFTPGINQAWKTWWQSSWLPWAFDQFAEESSLPCRSNRRNVCWIQECSQGVVIGSESLSRGVPRRNWILQGGACKYPGGRSLQAVHENCLAFLTTPWCCRVFMLLVVFAFAVRCLYTLGFPTYSIKIHTRNHLFIKQVFGMQLQLCARVEWENAVHSSKSSKNSVLEAHMLPSQGKRRWQVSTRMTSDPRP